MLDRFITVYLLWISVLAGLTGLLFQLVRQIHMTRRITPPVIRGNVIAHSAGDIPVRNRNFFVSHDPFLMVITLIFHVLVITVPVSLYAHNEMIFLSWGFRLPSVSQYLSDILSATLCVTGLILLLRRLLSEPIRKLTRADDILFLVLALIPFITGIMAYNSIEPYRVILYVHILSSELLFILAGWTRLGHMIFFLVTRLFIHGEFNPAGSRGWR